MKKKTQATVLYHCEIAAGIYDLWIETDLAMEAHAGQFIGVYTKDKSKLLPRPISICQVYTGEDAHGLPFSDKTKAIRLVYRVTPGTSGTADISSLEAGDTVEILGILGNGYDCDTVKDKKVVLMGGGIGIPPMLELGREIVAKGQAKSLTVILGYRNSDFFLKEDFEAISVPSSKVPVKVCIATEDGSFGTKGNVLDVQRTLEESGESAEVYMSCGPMPMLRAIASHAKEKNAKAFISLEERMACGVGACLGCITKTKEKDHHSHVNNTRICTDGPVFDAEILDI